MVISIQTYFLEYYISLADYWDVPLAVCFLPLGGAKSHILNFEHMTLVIFPR